jgi:hypothetical protein
MARTRSRVPASEIEAVVGAAVRRHLDDDTLDDTRQLISARVARVEVRPAELAITLATTVDAASVPSSAAHSPGSDSDQHDGISPAILIVPWTKPPAKRRRDIIAPDQGHEAASQPIRADYRARLVAAIARGRLWLSQIETGAVNGVTEIAIREDCSPRHVNMTISLAFPSLSAVEQVSVSTANTLASPSPKHREVKDHSAGARKLDSRRTAWQPTGYSMRSRRRATRTGLPRGAGLAAR